MVPVSTAFHLCDTKEHSTMDISPELGCNPRKLSTFSVKRLLMFHKYQSDILSLSHINVLHAEE